MVLRDIGNHIINFALVCHKSNLVTKYMFFVSLIHGLIEVVACCPPDFISVIISYYNTNLIQNSFTKNIKLPRKNELII